jgi:hypothetical protein
VRCLPCAQVVQAAVALIGQHGAWALAAQLVPACAAALHEGAAGCSPAAAGAQGLCEGAQAFLQQLQQQAAGAAQQVSQLLRALAQLPGEGLPAGQLPPAVAGRLLQELLSATCAAAAAGAPAAAAGAAAAAGGGGKGAGAEAAAAAPAPAAAAAAAAHSLVQHSAAQLLPAALLLLAAPPTTPSPAQNARGLLAAALACAANSGEGRLLPLRPLKSPQRRRRSPRAGNHARCKCLGYQLSPPSSPPSLPPPPLPPPLLLQGMQSGRQPEPPPGSSACTSWPAAPRLPEVLPWPRWCASSSCCTRRTGPPAPRSCRCSRAAW